jgi:hypothetical protein
MERLNSQIINRGWKVQDVLVIEEESKTPVCNLLLR